MLYKKSIFVVVESPQLQKIKIATILDNDHTFIGRYLEDQFTKKEHLIRHNDSRDYSFIWLRNDYVDIMQRGLSF
jgi:hypothetical protein